MAGRPGLTPAAMSAGTTAPVPYTWLAPHRPNQDPSLSWARSSQTTPRRTAAVPARPSADSASTTCAVTSADGGSVTAPKSQKGSLVTSAEVLSASKAPHPPSLDCIPAIQRSPRSPPRGRRPAPGAPPAPHRRVPAPGSGAPARTRQADPAEREQDLGGVVDVGVAVVVELERPATWVKAGPAHLPVPGPADLLLEQPGGRPGQRGIIGRNARVGERDNGEHGVPDW